jgi:NADH-quinone oxidoreductase subunit B
MGGEGYSPPNSTRLLALREKFDMALPFATIMLWHRFMATMGAHYDLARFGSERVGFSPRQCDLLMVMGTIAKKWGPVVKTGLPANGRT